MAHLRVTQEGWGAHLIVDVGCIDLGFDLADPLSFHVHVEILDVRVQVHLN